MILKKTVLHMLWRNFKWFIFFNPETQGVILHFLRKILFLLQNNTMKVISNFLIHWNFALYRAATSNILSDKLGKTKKMIGNSTCKERFYNAKGLIS